MTARSFARHAGGAALTLALAGLLCACEKPQGTADINAPKKLDTPAWEGGADASFRANGWKPGDKASWEAELRKRNEGQNEYLRAR